jgi:hypothetical protein
MKMVLTRKWVSSSAVVGELTIDGVFQCYTLEDPDEAGDRIPLGTYRVVVDMSKRFGKLMPHVLGNGVDERGIRIHAGNTQADTIGCILVGNRHGWTSVFDSKLAFLALMSKLSLVNSASLVIKLELEKPLP